MGGTGAQVPEDRPEGAAEPARQWCADCGAEAFSYDALCWRCGGRLTTRRPHRRRHSSSEQGSGEAASLERVPRHLGGRGTPAADEQVTVPRSLLSRVSCAGWLIAVSIGLLVLAQLVTHYKEVEDFLGW